MKYIKNSLIFLLLSFVFSSCKCKKESDKPFRYIDNDMKAYFGNVHNGSWWVYEDSVGNKDSSFVNYYSHHVPSHAGKRGGVASSPEDESIVYDIVSSIDYKMTFTLSVDNRLTVNIGSGDGQYDIEKDNNIYKSVDFKVKMLDSLNIFNNKYKNVLIVNYSNINGPHYYCKEIGIIQKRINIEGKFRGIVKLKKYNVN